MAARVPAISSMTSISRSSSSAALPLWPVLGAAARTVLLGETISHSAAAGHTPIRVSLTSDGTST